MSATMARDSSATLARRASEVEHPTLADASGGFPGNRFGPFWRAETGFFLVLWLGLLIAGRSGLFHDPGTFWHTVVGNEILTTGHLIYTDTFSFTFAGRPWVAHQWLGECVMAVVHRISGFDGLLLVTATLLAGLYTWVAHRLLRAGLHWSLCGVIVLFTIAASSSHFHVRPHLATIAGIGITVAFLCDFEAGRIGIRRLFWLVPIFVLWANVHGGLLGGLCTVVLAVAGWTALRSTGRESPVLGWRTLGALSALIAACVLGAFVNPYGWRLPWAWVTIMDSSLLPHIIREHAPLDVTRPYGWCFLLLGGLYAVAVASAWPRFRISWLLPLVWFLLACTRVRHAPLFSITAAIALADLLPDSRFVARLVRSGSDWFHVPGSDGRRFRWRPALIPVAAVTLALGLQISHSAVPVLGSGWARLDPAEWPVALLPELQRAQPGNIFNEYADGGFLIYFAPGLRVFVDDRCELYGDDWLREYVVAESGDAGPQMRAWQKRYASEPFSQALTRTGSAFDRYFQENADWQVVRQTPTATLYRRTIPSDGAPSRVHRSTAD